MKKHVVKLTEEERRFLKDLVKKGKGAMKKIDKARILLKVDESKSGEHWKDEDISKAFDVNIRTVERLRERFVEEGLEVALERKEQSRRRAKKIDGEAEAHLIALACSRPPEGRNTWTLRLLADKMVELEYVDTVSYETVRRTLKKTNLSLG